jgi:uncharacterized protein YigA (DUF484 family)
MSTRQTENLTEAVVTDKEVADFLLKHREFFDEHPEILAELNLQHPTGKAISLIERQVDVLRQQKKEVEKKLNNLIQIARENDNLNKRIQKLTLELLSATSADDIFTIVDESLHNDFDADRVHLILFRTPQAETGSNNVSVVKRQDDGLEIFNKFFEAGKPICGRLNKEQSAYLFGDEEERIASAALVPLCHADDCVGMLAIGSFNTGRFHSGMGTLFLSYLGDMIGRTLHPVLDT